MAQLVERRTRDTKTRDSNPVMITRKLCQTCSVKNEVLIRRCAQLTPVCVRTHNNGHVRTLRKLEETRHALVGLGSAAFAAAVTLPR